MTRKPVGPKAIASRALKFSAPLGLLWLCLTGTDWKSWTVGAPAVAVAAWLAAAFVPMSTQAVSPWRLPSFVVFFISESIRGGWDVARRALARDMELAPGLVEFKCALNGPAKSVLCATISLLPGTAVVQVNGNSFLVHTLDVTQTVEQELRELEDRVAALFGQKRRTE